MKKLSIVILLALIALSFCVSCTETYITFYPRTGFHLYEQDMIDSQSGSCSNMGDIARGSMKLSRFIQKRFSDLYVGTSISNAVLLSDPSVIFYTQATDGEEIPVDTVVSGEMDIYVGFIL